MAKQKTATDMRSRSDDQLRDDLLQLKREQFNLRFQTAAGQLEKTARIRGVRREIARVRTVLAERAGAGQASVDTKV